MAELLPWIVTIVGLTLMALQLVRRWPGWLGFPFLIVTGGATLAAGISPLVEDLVEVNWGGNYLKLGIPGYYSDELPAAIGLVLLSYGSLLLGMLTVYFFSSSRKGKRPESPLVSSGRGPWFDAATTERAWRASAALFGFGVLCNALVIYMLIQVAPLIEWSSSRSTLLFTSGGFSGLYEYASALSVFMQIGGWGLLIFAAPSRARIKFAVAVSVLFPALQVLFGSRLSLITSIYAVLLVFHYGVKPLRKRQWLGMLVLGLAAFSILSILRFDISQPQEVIQVVAKTLLVPRSISEEVWALRNWPENIQFFGGEVTIHGWQRMFPSARFVETQSTWQLMVELFYRGRSPDAFRQGGGIHFGFPVEQYIDLGYVGMIGVGLLYGFALGVVYEWQARQPKNPFLILLAVAATITLLGGLDGKMARSVGNFFFFLLLPIGLIALLTASGVAGRRWRAMLPAALYCVVMFFLLRILTGLDLFSYLLVCFFAFSYICSLFVVHFAGETELSQIDAHMQERFLGTDSAPGEST